MEKNNYVIDFFVFIYTLFIILSSNTIYYTSAQHNWYISELMIASLIGILIFLILFKKIDLKKIGNVVFFCILYFFTMITWLLINNSQNIYNFICIFFVLFPICLLIYKTSKYNVLNKFLKYYVTIMLFLAIISIIFYFLGPIFNIIKYTGKESIYWGGIKINYSYFWVFFCRQKEFFFYRSIYRNTGIFTEGPMYSLSLVIALSINTFLLNDKKFLKKIIFLFTIITTISTTGIIVSAIIIALDFLKNKYNSKVIRYIKILIFPICIIILGGVSVYFYSLKQDTSSYETRIDDYVSSFLAWKQKPIFGNGYGNNDAIKFYMSSFRADNKGLSNSIMVLLAQGGIVLFMFYFGAIINILKCHKDKEIIKFVIIIIILFVTTIFLYMPMLINLLAISYSVSPKKIKENDGDIYISRG